MKRTLKQEKAVPQKRAAVLIISCVVLVVLLIAAFQIARQQTKQHFMEEDLRNNVRAIGMLHSNLQILSKLAFYADEPTFDARFAETKALAGTAQIQLPIYQTSRWFLPDPLERYAIINTEFGAVWVEFEAGAAAHVATQCTDIAVTRNDKAALRYLEYNNALQEFSEAIDRYQSFSDPTLKMVAGEAMIIAANHFQTAQLELQDGSAVNTLQALDIFLTLPLNASEREYYQAKDTLFNDGYFAELNRCSTLVNLEPSAEEKQELNMWNDQISQTSETYRQQEEELWQLLQETYEDEAAATD